MENQNIALTLTVGVLASAALFFLFYKGLKRSGKLSALLTVLVVQAVYIPLAALNWAGLDVFAIHFGFYTMTAVILAMITTAREQGGARFHWGLGIIIGFFLILAVVDATIITLANSGASAEFVRRFLPEPKRESATNVSSAFPGTVAYDYQKKYDLYNNYMRQLQTQRERGWQLAEGWLEKPRVGQASPFSLRITDKVGQLVTGAQVVVEFLRPSNKQLDQRVVLAETEPGRYNAAIQLPAPGQWSMVITVTRAEEVHEVKGETWVEAQ